MTTTSGYAPVNGLQMYYEEHGSGRPLVLIHGALSGIGTSFGTVLPYLAKNRRVIAVEFQAHGRTADVDRPLTVPQLAEDVAALIRHLGVEEADLFGYSMGSAIALQVAVAHPELVGKLVLATIGIDDTAMHPGVLDGIEELKPEHLAGTPFAEEYARIAPDPAGWATTVEKIKQLDMNMHTWPAEQVRAVAAPTLLMFGDSDIVRPEHAVEVFRLLGGGVAGDTAGLPKSQLAILPGTTHISLVQKTDWVVSMVEAFLDRPV